ncbi:hypothetical protein SEA_VERITY_17 [Gordonia phage Verity]|uniref:Uncharacterized protein n=2 Tax=Zitchvirus TaxID=2948963 RepID=A0A514DIR4_9CAUD|nr:hypothetical protein J1775_gp17 [Gordonia phage Zipp]YP_010002855.1 hypothetical protein J1776_gp17 [Gordonia phage Verity]QPO16860.1 hypothetical protein SEA_DELREY21_17 [Gordonia phage Delrey21]QXN74143.1 ribosome modulation factor [Gordonia phage DoctorFroggo]QDH93171.1 hypothetical protein SEA_ZIPP_17 [Gordonia phage Zipp]QDH93503.1 hypothetical protein SEA_VERITY_17 [Gordonia phage Verity]
MTTRREQARRAQPMPTAAEARAVLAEGRASRPGAGNPYAGRRVLGGVWALGNRESAAASWAAKRKPGHAPS